MKFKPKTIHLSGKGFGKVLGELEAKIMELVWQSKETSVRTVCDNLAKKKHKLSFNTTMTVMNRLIEKGLLKKHDKEGTYVYSPVVSEKDFSRSVAKDIISAVVKDPALFSVSSFTDLASDLDKETLQKLKDLINKK